MVRINEEARAMLKLWCSTCTLFISIMFYTVFTLIFLMEGKIIYISVNNYNEGLIEFIIISVALSFALVGFYLLLVDKTFLRSSKLSK